MNARSRTASPAGLVGEQPKRADPALQNLRKSTRAVVNGQNVNFSLPDKPVDDPVRRMDHFAHRWIREFGDHATGLREVMQPFSCCNQLCDDNRRVLGRILTDERVNGGEVGLGLVGPKQGSHERNRFLTSS